MKTVNCQQGTPEWAAARAGCVTASRIVDVLARIKSGEAAVRKNYKAQVVAEILTGQPMENGYVSAEMQRGTETEPLARAAYELRRGVMVDQIGFILHPTLPRCGASPDGLVGADGLVEIKCPNTATHLNYILADAMPADYQPQMLWQMECAERSWCDFVSYDPRLPEHLQLFIKRFNRDDKRLAEIRSEVEKFQREVEEILAKLPKAPDPLTITDSDLAGVGA